MRNLFKELASASNPICLTLILPTHRTAPDNQQDRINLKNLTAQAEASLRETYGARELSGLLEKMALIDEIDLQHSKEGLLIFIGEHTFEYARVLFRPEQRFVIDSTFATRDLIRQMLYEDNYYVLAMSQSKVRLFEGSNEHLVEIKDKNFPGDNSLYTSDAGKASQSNTLDKYIEEFYNRTDKHFYADHYKVQPGHLVLAGTERNIAHYQNIADHKSIILASVEGSFDDTPAHAVAEKAWPVVRAALAARRQQTLEILNSIPTGSISTDLSEVWKLIHEGRGGTLYVEKDFIQAGVIAGETLMTSLNGEEELQNDVVDEIIEATLQFGGTIQFMDNGSLDAYGKLALVLRY
jgi:hypothetical protein